ncbi:MAG: (deoxy)nucleoside triphosphate pyrophosphohydrolase [Clostridia bacterium]|nr:(deoxy)nucleoside triphosphate pyrophosphohydrolase [Clostridia bacterium]
MEEKITRVAAALIWDGGKFMICQRPAHKARGLLWEFVGGKQEKDEELPDTLARECMEELGVKVKVYDIFMQLVHKYPDLTVELTLFNAEIESGTPQLLEHNDIKWITPDEIPLYDFCPADIEILKKIQEVKND